MRLILQVTAGVVVAALVIWAVLDPDGFRHTLWGYSKDEQAQAWQKVQATADEGLRTLKSATLEEEIKVVTMRHGEAAGATYRLCHTSPPTTKAHKLQCGRLDKQKAKDDVNDAKHPW